MSNAQSAANIATAQEQQRLNMINTHGPNGSVVYQADPTAPGGYSQTTSLSPAEQQKYDASNAAQNSALGIANQQIGRVGDALGQKLDLNSLPGMQYGVGNVNQAAALKYGFDPGQAVQGQVGGDLEAARKEAADASYAQATSRLDPQYAQMDNQLRTRLANQGLEEGSDAYRTAYDNFSRGKNDAYNQATYSSIQAGNQAANDQFQRQLSQGQFANQAAAQQYGQNQGQAGFHNTAVGQQFGQDMSNAQLANQQAALQNQARNQALQEQAYAQNQPLNQFSALLGSGQVAMPNGVQYTPTQVGQTDVLGAYGLNQQAQQAAYQAKANQQSGLMGGLFSLGSAAIMASDRRLKTHIREIGRRADGLGIYVYRYVGEVAERIGVMADEVRKIRPDLVIRGSDGFDRVNYAGLDLAHHSARLRDVARVEGAAAHRLPKQRGRADLMEAA